MKVLISMMALLGFEHVSHDDRVNIQAKLMRNGCALHFSINDLDANGACERVYEKAMKDLSGQEFRYEVFYK